MGQRGGVRFRRRSLQVLGCAEGKRIANTEGHTDTVCCVAMRADGGGSRAVLLRDGHDEGVGCGGGVSASYLHLDAIGVLL